MVALTIILSIMTIIFYSLGLILYKMKKKLIKHLKYSIEQEIELIDCISSSSEYRRRLMLINEKFLIIQENSTSKDLNWIQDMNKKLQDKIYNIPKLK